MESAVSEIADVPESAVSATSVHTQEINRHFLDESESDFEPVEESPLDDFLSGLSYRDIVFGKYPDLVPVLEQVLADHDEGNGTYKLEKFRACRTKVWFEQNMDTGKMRRRSNSCRERWCPACGEVKKNLVARNCERYFSRQPVVRFLTITQRHSGTSLEEQIVLAKKNLLRFRRSKEWKKFVDGSVWFMQTKWSYKSCGWHVHFHMLLVGSYWPQKRLSEKWHKITGDSYIVYIEQVYEKKLRSVIGDIARYAGLPANMLDVPAKHRQEVIRATERSRMCGATGVCRKGVALCQPKIKPDNSRWRRVCSWKTVQKFAMDGDKNAWQFFLAGWNEEVFFNARSYQEYEDLLDNESADFLSPVEPMPPSLFSPNERSPPGMGACYYEGDVLAKNAPW
ncbi:hypothetical protein ES703_97005 [subsurface metagenome]